MAFTSETTLKFGSTTINFAVITLLDYSLENEKAGAFSYRRKEVISLQGYFSNRETAVPIKESFEQIKSLLQNSTDFVDLQLNNKSYGKARFLGYSFPASVTFDENAVRFTKINIQLEILKDDSTTAYADANLPTAVRDLTDIWFKLKNFTENFSFRLGEDGNFEVEHSLSFGFDNIDKSSDTVVATAANQVANAFFAQGLDSLSSIRQFYSNTDFQISATDYGSSLLNQTVDLLNYTFSYSKSYSLLSDNGSTTTETLLTEINYGQDGVITVVEKGRVKGKGSNYATARSNAITKLNSNISSAYTRCNAAFTRYFSTNYARFARVIPKYNSTDGLESQPTSITRDLSEFGPEVGYEITFTTDNSYTATRIHSYSISLNKTAQGVYESSIDGSIKYYTNKNKNFFNNLSDIKSIIDNDTTLGNDLVTPYYAKVAGSGSYSGIKVGISIDHTKFGVETRYTKRYSNATNLISSGLIRQVSMNQNLAEPISRFSTANVPGYYAPNSLSAILGKEVIYQTRQYREATKTITLDIKINRDSLYSSYSSGSAVNNSPTYVFTEIRKLFNNSMLNKITGQLFGTSTTQYGTKAFGKIYAELNVAPSDLIWFLEDLKLSIDNSYNLTVSMSFKYLVRKEAS
jgi:hypothetical protein